MASKLAIPVQGVRCLYKLFPISKNYVTKWTWPLLIQCSQAIGPVMAESQEVCIMRLLILLAAFSGMLFSSGCALHQVKGEVAGVEIEAKTANAGGDFCPPGQAKKDNC